MIMDFKLHSSYVPTGDQPAAIAALCDGLSKGYKEQILLGVTGSGKTFTVANIIAEMNKREGAPRPALILAHNKTLAGQLCAEFREFFPENAVEYFVSYYDYYQPEAYIPGKDMYIEKDSAINDEIDRLRHSATLALAERRDVIIVASVSCIYGIGAPEEYRNNVISLRPNMEVSLKAVMKQLIVIQYTRNDIALERGKFRVKGDVLEIFPVGALENQVLRIEFFGDEIDRISEFNKTTGDVTRRLKHVVIFPASHYVINRERLEPSLAEIKRECEERVEYFSENHKLIEAQRIAERTMYDIEMLRETGMCKGIENYSRILNGKPPGSTPVTLIDHFPKDFLMFADESHVSLPQVRGMHGGDKGRKTNLVEYGFRLPSAFDNRPLDFTEFLAKLNQVIYVSATPADFEKSRAAQIAEQLIRPTGLLDPIISVRPTAGQIEDLLSEINTRIVKGEKILVVTLTKKMAEDLTD
ncbi:MAG: DEAD/DEAH box helicase family protein, partial [Oscillospiraceae bacterium]|nr:DEAD/DEAH box helicase family protein [Oscillospiraceae bacterium]